jgi:hypothetical protein
MDIIKPSIYAFLVHPFDELRVEQCEFYPDHLRGGATVVDISSWLLTTPEGTHARHRTSWNNLLKLFLWLAEQRGLI